MLVCSSILITVCMFIVSKTLIISSATVIVHTGGAIWLNPFATVLFTVCSAVPVEFCFVPVLRGCIWYVCCYVTNFFHQLKINTDSDPDTELRLHGNRDRLPSEETISSHSVCGHRLDSCLRYSILWHTNIQDCEIALAARHHSMAVMLPKRETSYNELKRNQVGHKNPSCHLHSSTTI